jgi:hypothetical protein
LTLTFFSYSFSRGLFWMKKKSSEKRERGGRRRRVMDMRDKRN